MHINQQAQNAAMAAVHDLQGLALAGAMNGLDLTRELEWTGAVIHDGGAQEWYGISALHCDDQKRHTVWVGTGGDIMSDTDMREAQAEQFDLADEPETARITTTDEMLMTTSYDVMGSRQWVVAQLEREGWQTCNINSLCTVLMHPAMGQTFKMVK